MGLIQKYAAAIAMQLADSSSDLYERIEGAVLSDPRLQILSL